MSKKFIKLLLAFVLFVSVLIKPVLTAQAQDGVPTPTPTPISSLVPLLTPDVTKPDPNVVTFAQFGEDEIRLTGPYDGQVLTFALPADWKLAPGARLNLSYEVSFDKRVVSFSNLLVNGSSAGTLSVFLNGVTIGVLQLDEIGGMEKEFYIPLNAYVSPRADGRMVLSFSLDSGAFCLLSGGNLMLLIHPTSSLVLPHDNVPLPTSLVNFPRPIFQDSFEKDTVLFVVPDVPSTAELQAAFTVASGLSNLSGNKIVMDMTTLIKFKPEEKNSTQGANHIIFIGKPTSLSILRLLHLPHPVKGGQFEMMGSSPDDGLIEMINSPWSSSHIVFVVSGNTDQGVVKAAQAVSTGVLRPSYFPNLAVVQQVQPDVASISQATDFTLADLGFKGDVIEGRGSGGSVYRFYIPPGWTVAPDANFELHFGHSALVDYDQSGIIVMLNDRPIGSVRMDEAMANQPINQVRIALPSSAVEVGYNNLEIIVDLSPVDICSPLGSEGLWVTIWPESVFHLPLTPITADEVSTENLNDFPEPYTYSPTLGNTAFVVARNDLEAWRGALKIASYLGEATKGPLTELSVFWGNAIPDADRSKYNFLVVGRPSQLPIVGELNQYLPGPFLDEKEMTTANNYQVTYRIPPDSPMGYIEIIESPWNPDNVVLAILGNTTQGVSWAASALVDPLLGQQLAGNFAEVTDQQIVTTDTRIASIEAERASNGASSGTGVPSELSTGEEGQPLSSGLDWVLLALILTVVLIVAIVIVAIVRNRFRDRSRHKAD